ncbi:hypothetical protein QTO34_000328, partial [Cnephaeus nilssonii]
MAGRPVSPQLWEETPELSASRKLLQACVDSCNNGSKRGTDQTTPPTDGGGPKQHADETEEKQSRDGEWLSGTKPKKVEPTLQLLTVCPPYRTGISLLSCHRGQQLRREPIKKLLDKKEASSEKEVNEMEASNLSEKEFRKMVIRWLKRMEDKFNNMWKNQEEMKKNQEEMKNDITAIKNSIESINSRLEEAEDRISELEDK